MSLTAAFALLVLRPVASSPLAALSARVLNFFPVPVNEECLADDKRRTGICLNAYECRIQSGEARGNCALGFGVCCVFTATCGGEVKNNVTYFVNPEFPGLSRSTKECMLTINKVERGVSQLRLDFVHFNLAQPNRRTGVCESDRFFIRGGNTKEMSLCGSNSGQHLLYDLENVKNPIQIIINMTKESLNRMWEIRLSQVEFNRRAPPGCTQYYTGLSGIIQTMNYAVNGRHLASQDYNICIRQEARMCSIAYEPCDDNSIKVGAPIARNVSAPSTISLSDDVVGSGDGPTDVGPTPLILGAPAAPEARCRDRVIMPCDMEDFVSPTGIPGLCEILSCGMNFCTSPPCRIETNVRPFNLRVLFGPGTVEKNPEENLGLCLRYSQQPCG